MGNQYDCSAGITGAASVYSHLPDTASRISTGIRTNTHSARNCGRRNTTAAAMRPQKLVRLMNSYMLPHGAREVARPRSTIHISSKTALTKTTAIPARSRRSVRDRRGISTTTPGLALSRATTPGAVDFSSVRVRAIAKVAESSNNARVSPATADVYAQSE